MTPALLVTVRFADRMRTSVFDESVQSVLWLGLDASVTDANALCCVESDEAALVLRAVHGARITSGGAHDWVRLCHEDEGIYHVSCEQGMVTLHVRAASEGKRRFRKLRVTSDVEFEIGRGQGCGIRYAHAFVSVRHARIRLRHGVFTLWDLRSANGTYVNDNRVPAGQPVELRPGDVVRVLDLTLCIGEALVCVNEPEEVLFGDIAGLEPLVRSYGERTSGNEDKEGDRAAFYPAPRLSKSIRPLNLQVDEPPARREEERQSALMQVGPSFLMGLSSVFMAVSAIARMAGGADLLSSAPSLAMAVSMVGGSLVWPLVSRSYARTRHRREEVVRTQTYVAYLDGVQNIVAEAATQQAQILKETHRCVDELMERAACLSPLLMNRATTHEDFLALRVGVGDIPACIDISWPQPRFSLVEDPLLDKVAELAEAPPLLREVPVIVNLATHWILGILGERRRVWEFTRGLMVQVCALYSYQEVKVVLVGSEAERTEWDYLVSLGHFYAVGEEGRLAALSHAGLAELDRLLDQELEARQELRAEVLGDYGTYYVVVCSNTLLAERSTALRRIARLRRNVGFSLLYMGSGVHDLPRECSLIIDLRRESAADVGLDTMSDDDGHTSAMGRSARMFERADVLGTLVTFDPDAFVGCERARRFALDLARARLDSRVGQTFAPHSIGFLEMFEAGSVEHLNIGKRWVENDASHTLQTLIGVDARGEAAYLNLHENVHGPHGLIAGTTGSGKSEFIITFVLSLCVNYAPDEVAFVFIDYKGGGLAGAFCNERHCLPHVAGTITNLDGGAIRRSLVSIQSELRRRQQLFNEARDLSGESTMDIYKYLALRRQGLLEHALPHLVIVADEFAELKQQEPEFMDELVSAARIGRSLGIHLVLATQKPSGVVDDQIWSNSRFKVALKVADAADSREMIRCDDAAEIKRPGQYCMLVGYNESFTGGQVAYSGGSYIPQEHFEPRKDQTVELLDAEGHVLLAQRPVVSAAGNRCSEIDAVLTRIEDTACLLDKHAERLWLDPLPQRITLAEIRDRYDWPREAALTCVVGVLDDPERQRQSCLYLDMSNVGNVLLCGSQSSDADGLVASMLYALLSVHDAEDVWAYALDFGSGGLRPFEALPQVGGVVVSDDVERTHNLFSLLEDEIARRRDLMMAQDDASQPHVVVVITNLLSLCERYEELGNRLATLTREAPRYGIHFVVSAATASSVRMRLRTNFDVVLPLSLNDASDYSLLLGGMGSVPIPHGARRGLARVGKRVLEFQGASIALSVAEEREAIERLAAIHGNQNAAAPCVPVLPRRVTCRDMGIHGLGSLMFPVGFSKNHVAPVYFDLEKLGCMLVLGDDLESLGAYLRGVREALDRMSDVAYCFVDTHRVLGEVNDERVLQDEREVCQFVRQLDAGTAPQRIIVFSSIVQTILGLPPAEGELLGTYLAKERGAGQHFLVVTSELWRTKGLYQDWYKVVSAYGNGVWVGNGFADQTVLRYARMLPACRQRIEPNEGFLVVRGGIDPVRLIEEEAVS